jgi:cellulose synthase/poly-beta-1,6-N-acetylglucosamine synthase-like glycosyltransferase
MDFSLQLRDLGMRLDYAADAVCYTEGAVDLRSLVHQRMRWRFGGMQCMWRHRDLLFDTRKGRRALGFYELPVLYLAYAQLLVYPFVVVFAVVVPVLSGEWIYLSLLLLAVPLNHVVVLLSAGMSLRSWHLLIMTPYMMAAIMVEHVAMLQAVFRLTRGKSMAWTRWSRVGIDDTLAEPVPLPVPVPARTAAGVARAA